MDFTAEHENWLAVGEIIPLIREPVSAYVDEIVKGFHAKLAEDFLKYSACTNCKTASGNLCSPCQKWWLKKLEVSHEKGASPSWKRNCNSEKWYCDHWEVAKFFMPTLGTPAVKDAASTDLSSLLNVLEWMKKNVFLGKTRLNVDFVRKLRSDVRNSWAHSPKHEVSDQQKKDSFQIGADFLEDLKNVFPNGGEKIEETNEKLQQVKEHGVADLVKSKTENLFLYLSVLKQIQAELSTAQKHDEPELVSCLPEKLGSFTGREKEIQDFIEFFHKEETGVVSLHGGPGFGKSALAVNVSWRLHDQAKTPVIFSHLSTASTIDEVILPLCRDVGLNPEEDPTSSLILWLKKLHDVVVFVLDDIDELLDKNCRSEFDDFMRLLRKNSNQKLKIITTSRASYSIDGLTCQQIRIEEMDEESSLAFLKSTCRYKDTEFLQSLAELCGYIPLAMCIASSLANTYEEPQEILEHLRDQPMEALQDDQTNQFVYKAFNTSHEKLNEQQKDALLRLTVFEGSFTKEAAKQVLGGTAVVKQATLTQLVNRSLVKKDDAHRFSIHLLVKRFLIEKSEGGETRKNAEKQMVAYYLELGNTRTLVSYTKDGFKTGRETLKREAHHFENTLSIIRRKQNDPEILELLTNSNIYKTTCRFFYFIAKNIISEVVLKDFLQSCADVAHQTSDNAKKINFECILADYEGRKSIWKSEKYFEKMKKIEEEYSETTGNDAECAYFLYQLGRYTLNKYRDFIANRNHDTERDDELLKKAEHYIRESLELRQNLPISKEYDSSLKNADIILSLLQLGNIWKRNAKRNYHLKGKQKSDETMKEAKKYYKEAIQQAEENLGEHEETSACYKILGDLLLLERKNEKAMECYDKARRMREELKLDTSEAYVLLLNNIGQCLMFMRRNDEATEILEKARDIAEKLAENDDPTFCKRKVRISLAKNYKRAGQKGYLPRTFKIIIIIIIAIILTVTIIYSISVKDEEI